MAQKLYTEEQVKQMIEKSQDTGLTAEYLMLTRPPIELPSDEEIRMQTQFTTSDIYTRTAFFSGAKWMKEQILKQNK